jgi:diguanylate cyclase (GGDEF)-like protein
MQKQPDKRIRQLLDALSGAAFEYAPIAIVLSSTDGKVKLVNTAFCQMTGYTREEALKLTAHDLAHPEDVAAGCGLREIRLQRKDGSHFWAGILSAPVRRAEGAPLYCISVVTDITDLKAQQEQIARLSRLDAMLSGINSAIVRIRDRGELLRESCRIAHKAGGFSVVWIGLVDARKNSVEPIAWQGKNGVIHGLMPPVPDHGEKSLTPLAEAVRSGRPTVSNDAVNDPHVAVKSAMMAARIRSVAFLPLIVSGRVAGIWAMYSPFKSHFDNAEIELLSELAGNISFALEHLEKSERAAYLALYDELTGLANRRLFTERVAQFIHATAQVPGRLALALIDIERLRAVNKSLGRLKGDELLRQIGGRLAQAAGANSVARVSSNHFAVALRSIHERSEAEKMIAALEPACFAQPYQIDGSELKLRARVGVALFPGDGVDPEALLVSAETALRQAKAAGERCAFYSPDPHERTGVWLTLESKLGRALEREEFVLHYQPKVDTVTRRIVALEALIRWQSPELGLVPPANFIPLLEESGMILEVGAWALQRAALDHRRWADQGLAPPRVAVNVSAIQLKHRDFVRTLEQAIRPGVAPTGIDLEITETVLMANVEENIRKLIEVHALGVQTAIDDFGTGYSSLAYLAKLPVQALKIDRSFIEAMQKDSVATTLVQTIISLAHTLGLITIAEGVESEAQARYLQRLRCSQFQGYLISKPVPFEQVVPLLGKA